MNDAGLSFPQIELLNKILSACPDHIFINDKDGRFLYVNESAATSLGLKRSDIIGKTWRELGLPPDTIESFDANLKVVFSTGNPLTALISISTVYGARDFEYILTPVKGEDGRVEKVVSTVRDITERKRAEEALRESEEKYRSLIDSAGDAIFLTDFEGNLVEVNKQAERLTGYKKEELLLMNFGHLHPPEHVGAVIAAFKEGIAEGSGSVHGVLLLRKDGSTVPIDLAGSVIEYRGKKVAQAIVRDITELKKTEDALRDSEKRYRTLFESASDAIYVIDSGGENAGRIMEVNQAAAEMHGYTVDELLTMKITDLDMPETAMHALERMRRVLGGERIKFEASHRKKDGTVFPVEAHANLLKLDSHAYILAFDRDITESKQAKELSDALNDINAAINSTLDFNEIMQKVVVEAAEAIRADTAVVALSENGYWVVKYFYRSPEGAPGMLLNEIEAEYAQSIAKARQVVAINDALNDPRLDAEKMKKYDVKSVLAMPLIVRGEAAGVMRFTFTSAPTTFTDSHIDFANKLGVSISLALENAKLYSEERNISDILQKSLLIMPERIMGVDFDYLYRSATEAARVGGDFYDIFELEHARVGIIIGDVSGKGIEAAALTSSAKNAIKAYAYEDRTPAIVMSKANDLVTRVSVPGNFVTVFFGVLDVKTGNFTYCSAGHPPAIIKRAASGVELLTEHSSMIGAFSRMHYRSGKTTFNEDDILILYTDGIIEARSNGSFFGEKRLVDFISGLEQVSGKDIPQAIFDEVMRYARGRLTDDIALLSLSLEKKSS